MEINDHPAQPETSWTQCHGQEKERIQPEYYTETAGLEVYINPILHQINNFYIFNPISDFNGTPARGIVPRIRTNAQ